MLEDNNFIHLHVHSVYSIQDSLLKIDELLAETNNNNLKAVALTDHGSICGMSEFKVKATNMKIKPIFGAELYVKPNVETLTERGNKRNNSHLILLAKNQIGWKNLIKIHNHAWKNFYYKPTTDYEFIKENKEGIICLTACTGGDLNKSFEKGEGEFERYIDFIYSIFEEDLYLEAQVVDSDLRIKNLREAILSSGRKFVLTNDIHYRKKEDSATHNILMLIRDKKTIEDLKKGNAFIYGHNELYYKNVSELKSVVNEEQWQSCLKYCKEIYDKIEDIPILDKPHLPEISNNPKEEILKIIKENLRKIPLDKKEEYFSRIKKELAVYSKTNSLNYLLIVKDFLDFADKHGYLRNYGRGSACSSLVTYLMGIHHIDPVKNNLYFERFLNENRGIKMKVFD